MRIIIYQILESPTNEMWSIISSHHLNYIQEEQWEIVYIKFFNRQYIIQIKSWMGPLEKYKTFEEWVEENKLK